MPHYRYSLKRRPLPYDDDYESPTYTTLDSFERSQPMPTWPNIVTSRSKRGSLKLLAMMPLDILYEIFEHLHPLDLLHLARTSKRLREILMSRSCISVWKTALSDVRGLPFCPSDLTEPQFVNLVFDEHCHFCLAPNIREVFWACRIRCCSKCVNKYFIPESALEQIIPDGVLGTSRCSSIFPYIVYPKPRRNKPGQLLFYFPVAATYTKELKDIIRSSSFPAAKQWAKEKRREQHQRLVHAALCESWSIHWVYRRSHEFNLAINILLFVLLILLWHDKIW